MRAYEEAGDGRRREGEQPESHHVVLRYVHELEEIEGRLRRLAATPVIAEAAAARWRRVEMACAV